MAKSFNDLVAKTTTPRIRERAERRTRELLAEMYLAEMREAAGFSQKTAAGKLGIKQPSLSKLEKQKDMQIGTLQKLIKAYGGEVEIVAKFPKRNVRLIQFEGNKDVRSFGGLVPQLVQEKSAKRSLHA